MGDFNIDLFKSESCNYANQFVERLFSSSFLPLITKATRITQHMATLIDNIFTNDLKNLHASTNGIIFSDISNHLPTFYTQSKTMFEKNIIHKNSDISYRVINERNIKRFKNSVDQVSWSEILNEDKDSKKAFNIFSERCPTV